MRFGEKNWAELSRVCPASLLVIKLSYELLLTSRAEVHAFRPPVLFQLRVFGRDNWQMEACACQSRRLSRK